MTAVARVKSLGQIASRPGVSLVELKYRPGQGPLDMRPVRHAQHSRRGSLPVGRRHVHESCLSPDRSL